MGLGSRTLFVNLVLLTLSLPLLKLSGLGCESCFEISDILYTTIFDCGLKRDDIHLPQITSKSSHRVTYALEVGDLSKSYGRRPVLSNLHLKVGWGESLTILGFNGSGKTTLMNILSTLTKPDLGRVKICGHNPAQAGITVRNSIGVVTHNTLFYDHLTARENMSFFARLYALKNIESRIEHAAEIMGVEALLDRRIRTLSNGLRRRFNIARALLHDPAVLLLDEPESGLDQEAIALLDQVVFSYTKPCRALIMTSPSLNRAMGLGSHVAILRKGRIVYHERRADVTVESIERVFIGVTAR